MARIDWVHHRLSNWARWHHTMNSGGLGFATQAAFLADAADRDQPPGARIPVDEIEAEITHEAVEALKLGNGHLHQTLTLYYLRGMGITLTAKAMRRADSTVHANLARADVWLVQWFAERRQRKQAEAAQLQLQLRSPKLAEPAAPAGPGLQLLTREEIERTLAALAEERRAMEQRRQGFVGPPLPPFRSKRPVLRLPRR